MNIQIQTIGLIILTLLYIFYVSNKTLKLYTEKVFRRTLYISILSLSLDILSLVAIYYMEILPEILVILICKLYIITLVWEVAIALSYVITDLYSEKDHIKITRKIAIAVLIQSIIVLILPISIYQNGNVAYTYGLSVLFVYLLTILHIIATIVVLLVCWKRINKRRRFAVGFWMSIWIVAALIQYFNSGLLVVGFATVVGMLILFVVMENPESNIDRRTACFNSYALSEYLQQIFERKTSFGLLRIRFKNAGFQNDHEFYDNTIKKVASLISKRNELLVFRSVNDVIIISKNKDILMQQSIEILDSLDALHIACDAVLVKHAEHFSQEGELFRFISFVNTNYSENTEKLFIADDDAINRFCERSLIEQEISDALAEDRVQVFLQPIYSNTEKKFTSAEALVRIIKKNGELLPPSQFIPVAESSGQVVRIGERVFEKVCDFLKNTNAVSSGIHYIEINLSVVQCEMADLADRLISIIKKYDIDPSLINLEITETASVTARNILMKNMEKLIDYGFSFSLDDFGKGQSNLMYVVEMPVSIIKLDYDMSKAFFSSPKAKQVVRAVVSMAHCLNLKLVAEGIETKNEIDEMALENIDYIQGFYYSKPLPMTEFLTFISKNERLLHYDSENA